MSDETTKRRWQTAYDQQSIAEGENWRDFNGYRSARTYAMLCTSITRATRDWHNWRVLDAGSGSGYTGQFLTQHNRVTGLDFSHTMAGHARSVYENVLVGDVENLPLPTNSLDGLMAVGVWQCLSPDTPFIQEAARVVRPGGEVVLGWVLNADFLLYRRGVHFRLDPTVELSLLTLDQMLSLASHFDLIEIYAVLFPLRVLRLQQVPRWLRPFIPAYTLRLCV